jgi:hypothetical protein
MALAYVELSYNVAFQFLCVSALLMCKILDFMVVWCSVFYAVNNSWGCDVTMTEAGVAQQLHNNSDWGDATNVVYVFGLWWIHCWEWEWHSEQQVKTTFTFGCGNGDSFYPCKKHATVYVLLGSIMEDAIVMTSRENTFLMIWGPAELDLSCSHCHWYSCSVTRCWGHIVMSLQQGKVCELRCQNCPHT